MADKELVKKLDKAALDTRINLLNLCNQTAIHIGGDMSACDLMTAIWQYGINYDPENPQWEDRDRFILSKGHAAAVTSFSQAAIGCYETEDIFNEYATDFGRFGMHSCNLRNPYIDVSTGSLGHGLPVATGYAAALKKKGSPSRVYVVIGDGESEEGSIWEAAKRIKDELGKDIRVVNMHTIKPLDEEAILDEAKTGRIVAAQDHNLQGGLGEKVAAVLGKNGVVCDLIMRGCPEEFVPLATPEFLYARNGMDVDGLYEAMKELLEK